MQLEKLKNFKRGWFVGNISPSLWEINCEVGVQEYKKGSKHAAHYHPKGTEINVMVKGSALFHFLGKKDKEVILEENDILVIEPGEIVSFESLNDCKVVVFKTISDKNDKVIYKPKKK